MFSYDNETVGDVRVWYLTEFNAFYINNNLRMFWTLFFQLHTEFQFII